MENNQETVTQSENKTEVPVVPTDDKKETKTFTQEEVNAMILKAQEKESKKYEGIDVKKYKEWEQSQKTAEEKHQDTLKENEALKNKIAELENMSVVANAGVDSKFTKFVYSEVSQMDGDFEENLQNYLKDNAQFLNQKEESTATGMPVNKGSGYQESGVSAILKQRRPDLFK